MKTTYIISADIYNSNKEDVEKLDNQVFNSIEELNRELKRLVDPNTYSVLDFTQALNDQSIDVNEYYFATVYVLSNIHEKFIQSFTDDFWFTKACEVFLTEFVPEGTDDETLNKMVEFNKWQPFENYSNESLIDEIDHLKYWLRNLTLESINKFLK